MSLRRRTALDLRRNEFKCGVLGLDSASEVGDDVAEDDDGNDDGNDDNDDNDDDDNDDDDASADVYRCAENRGDGVRVISHFFHSARPSKHLRAEI